MLFERIENIKKLLQEQQKVFVTELSQQFQVSEVTIRKDLLALENAGIVNRFHGGAVLTPTHAPISTSEDFYHNKILTSLAALACEEIQDGDSIFLGSGRTCCILARMLGNHKNLTIVTNNISALKDLINKDFKLFLIGGEVTTVDAGDTLFASIEDPMKYLQNIYVNKAFTSISGIDLHAGLTVNSIITTYIYKSIRDITGNWYMLADHSKFGHLAMYTVEKNLSQVSCYITDQLDEIYKNYFTKNEIRYKTLIETSESNDFS